MVDGGQIFTQQLAQAHGQFTQKLGGLVALATTAISDKVDAGLAYHALITRHDGSRPRREVDPG